MNDLSCFEAAMNITRGTQRKRDRSIAVTEALARGLHETTRSMMKVHCLTDHSHAVCDQQLLHPLAPHRAYKHP